jgi:peptide/bleomycin uptake transporter|tara:strand:- start:12284 stop:13258 length:975 start_codon:yes stop_codon:yes gene_type:complete
MFKFFKQTKYALWAYLGSAFILSTLWFQVKIDVKINEWFGSFYDMIQKALAEPGAVTMGEYWAGLASFGWLAAMWITLGLIGSFFTAHYLFRWRASMVEWYHSVYDKARTIEGASQRVQEDTVKFARIVEGLGVSLIESIMVLVEFFPILLGLGAGITVLYFGEWEYGLVTAALVWSVGGTLLLVVAGWLLRLVGVEYDIQAKEAAYRKHLVKMEDDGTMSPKPLVELFDDVRKIHFRSYFQYLKFNVLRMAYLQVNVLTAYIFLAPAIVGGLISLGVMQQIIRAFGRVEGSMQFILKSWPTIIELISVAKRLREFEKKINEAT